MLFGFFVFIFCIASNLHGMQEISLYPDDLTTPTHWVNNPMNPEPTKIPNEYLSDPNFYIRKQQYYRPPNVINKTSLIACLVIHGTFGNNTKSFYNDENQTEQNYRHIKRFASWYATIKKKNLELLSYRWSGEWSHEARCKAGHQLLNLLYSHYKNAEKVLLSHSHGGNIANFVSIATEAEENPIDLMIHFACPRKEEWDYQPLFYKTLLYFYSDSDWVTILARADEEKATSALKKAGASLGGSGTLAIAGHCIARLNPYAKWIDGAVFLISCYTLKYLRDKVVELTPGTNDFVNHSNRITLGFRTKINGWNPDHSQIVDITQCLPEVIEKTFSDYTAHCFMSSGFHLNVDLNQNSIHIAIRQKTASLKKTPSMPDALDYLVRNNNLKNIFSRNSLSFNSIQDEIDNGNRDSMQYKTHYEGREITQNYPNDRNIKLTLIGHQLS